MPVLRAFSSASSLTASMSMSLAASSTRSIFLASPIVSFFFRVFLGSMLLSMSCRLIIEVSSIMPPPIMPTPILPGLLTVTSIFLSSSSPFLILALKRSLVFWFKSLGSCSAGMLVVSLLVLLGWATGGMSASRIKSSTSWAAFSLTASSLAVLTMLTACSTKSLTMLSTSRPT